MGTLRSRGQNEQKRKETNAEGGSTKYQTIVFQKQNGGIPQQISASEHRHPPSLLSFSLPVFSRSYVIPDPCWPPAFPKQLGQIQTSPNTHFDRAYIHTHTK